MSDDGLTKTANVRVYKGTAQKCAGAITRPVRFSSYPRDEQPYCVTGAIKLAGP